MIVESAIETMDAKAACLFLADEKRDIFVPAAQKGLSDDYLHAKPMRAKSIVKAVLKGGYLAIRDATTDPRVENHEAKKAEAEPQLPRRLQVEAGAKDQQEWYYHTARHGRGLTPGLR